MILHRKHSNEKYGFQKYGRPTAAASSAASTVVGLDLGLHGGVVLRVELPADGDAVAVHNEGEADQLPE